MAWAQTERGACRDGAGASFTETDQTACRDGGGDEYGGDAVVACRDGGGAAWVSNILVACRDLETDDEMANVAIELVTHVGHGWDDGDRGLLLKPDAPGYSEAQADAVANIDRAAFYRLVDEDHYEIIKVGSVYQPSHGLTFGALLFLSRSSAGAKTTTLPVGTGMVRFVGWVTGPDHWHYVGGNDVYYLIP